MDELKQMNAEALVISFGTPASAHAWQEETCTSFPLLLDPERSVYDAYGLQRSLLGSSSPRTVLQYVRLLLSGRRWRGIQGDSAQLGGDFVIDAEGIVRLAHPSHDTVDRPPVADLLALLRQLHEGVGDG